MCVDRIYLYRTLRKTQLKKKKKGPFLIKKEIRLRIEQGRRIHKKKLKPPPKYDCCAGDYSIREWFLEAERFYLKSYIRIRFWLIVKRLILIKEIKILNYRWVYIYKFDEYGRFIKYKVRLMVRGN